MISHKIRQLEQNENEPMVSKQPSGSRSMLKPASKKIGKEPKSERKALKVNTKAKRVDQNKRIMVAEPTLKNNVDEGEPSEPHSEMKLFKNKRSPVSELARDDKKEPEEAIGGNQSPKYQDDKEGNCDSISKSSD